jgi:hypothetical protein
MQKKRLKVGGRTGMGRQGPRPDVLTQENCRKVTRSVEDAEIKTNVLKQNSALLEVRGCGGSQTSEKFGWSLGMEVGGAMVDKDRGVEAPEPSVN